MTLMAFSYGRGIYTVLYYKWSITHTGRMSNSTLILCSHTKLRVGFELGVCKSKASGCFAHKLPTDDYVFHCTQQYYESVGRTV